MKVTIRDKDKTVAVTCDVFLEDSCDGVYVSGVDGNGKEWRIAEINKDGIRLCNGINKSSGWPLNNGRMKQVSV